MTPLLIAVSLIAVLLCVAGMVAAVTIWLARRAGRVALVILLMVGVIVAARALAAHPGHQEEVRPAVAASPMQRTVAPPAFRAPQPAVVIASAPWSNAMSEQLGAVAEPSMESVAADKPWVGRAGWKPEPSRSGLWVIAYSPALEPSPEQAMSQAKRAAVDLIANAPRSPGASVGHAGGAELPEDALRETIDAHLALADAFVQRIDRPYGKLYRAALLVHLTPQASAQIAHELSAARTGAIEAQREENERRTIMWVSCGLLIGFAGLAYLTLNSATRHYYAWQLRATTAVLIISCVAGALALT